jgi:hypothetical protein
VLIRGLETVELECARLYSTSLFFWLIMRILQQSTREWHKGKVIKPSSDYPVPHPSHYYHGISTSAITCAWVYLSYSSSSLRGSALCVLFRFRSLLILAHSEARHCEQLVFWLGCLLALIAEAWCCKLYAFRLGHVEGICR